MRYFLIALFCIISSAVLANDVSGFYQTKFPNAVILPNDGTHQCSENWPHMEGFCLEDYEGVNTLALLQSDNGDMKFSTHLSFFNGHMCSLNGVAKKHENGWLYTETISPEEMKDMEFRDEVDKAAFISRANCSLKISILNDNLLLDTDEDANCLLYCGARGSFDGTEFPLSSKTDKVLTIENIDCVGYFSDECEKQAEAAE